MYVFLERDCEPMIFYILQRIVRAIFTLFIFVTLLFFIIQAVPGETIIINPPRNLVEKQPAELPAESTPTAKATPTQPNPGSSENCYVEPLPKWMPEEDKEAYVRDECAGQILEGSTSGEQTLEESVPVEPQVNAQQAASAESVWSKPSAFQQYQYWMQSLLRGDLGVSTIRRRPVVSVLIELAPRTLLLFLPGALIGFFLGLRIGRSISWKRSGISEFGSTVSGVVLSTAFPPFLAFVMAYYFAYRLSWLPRENIIDPDLWLSVSVTPNRIISWLLASMLIVVLSITGIWYATQRVRKRRWLFRIAGVVLILVITFGLWITSGYGQQAGDILKHWLLPLITFILLSFGGTMLLMRASMSEVLQEPHIFTAKAKGLPDNQVRDRHAARLALIPVISRFVLELPLLIIGGFAVERIFFWNGLGQFLFEAANKNDFPLILGIVTVVAIVILASHLFVDILIQFLDPRQRRVSQAAKTG
jgi:peptide/nickel transport system permease protein